MDAHVALVNTRPETVTADLERAARLAGFAAYADAVGEAGHVLVLDVAWPRRLPAAGTAPWHLDGMALALAGRADVRAVAAGVPGAAPRRAGAELGWDGVLRTRGLKLTDLDAATARGEAPLQGRGAVLLPVLRTDSRWGLRGAVAAHLAWLPPHARATAMATPDAWCDLLRLRATVTPATFVVMDATVCGDRPGPGGRLPVVANVLLAGYDPVAVDAVAARLLGLDAWRLPWLRACQAAGLGSADLQAITVLGDADAGALRLPHVAASRSTPMAGHRWTPRVGAAVRDLLWYPTVGRRSWRRVADTPWGRLFATYVAKENA